MSKPTKSIVTNYEQYCLICGSPNTERHHLLMGTKHRPLAEEEGLVVGLCPAHHNSSNMCVHKNKEMKALSQMLAEACWERHYLAKKLADVNASVFVKDDGVDDILQDARDAFYKRYMVNFL